MAGKPIITMTTAGDGRLPTPVAEWPISRESFARLTKLWRPFGVWLSLWSHDGDNVAVDSEGARLWSMFWSHGESFRRQLSDFARAAVVSPEESPASARVALGPWWPDLGLIAAPVRRRRTLIGVVLGTVVFDDPPGEVFTRLCTQCQVDRQTMVDLASRAVPVHKKDMKHHHRFLESSVEQAREIEVVREEAAILTNNLENNYEELNLIYRISEHMRLPQKPRQVCERIARAVVDISRASAVGIVLYEHGSPDDSAGPSDEESVQSFSDRAVQAGAGAPDLRDLDRLSKSLSADFSSNTEYILLNNACNLRKLDWTEGWLEHLVALPLWHEQRLLGMLFAINCDDEGDFTSVDVQLFRAVSDRLSAFLENQRLYDGVTDLLMGLLHALVNSIDAKDPYTCGHSERVAFISRVLAQEANLSPAESERVYLAGLMHDIGKIGVPDAILCKPGKLTNEEFNAMKKHPEIGHKILSGVKQIADLMPGVLHHHERVDGRGYPHGLAGQAIPLLGRIICLGDCFDAMTTSRTYRPALPLPMAIAEIRRCSGVQLDPELADLFLRLDHHQLLEESRLCSDINPAIGHIGGLNTTMGESLGDRERRTLRQVSQAGGREHWKDEG